MLARAIEGLAGLLLAWATLRDVFYTAVVPGSSRGLLKISRRLVRLALTIWKHTKHRAVGVDFAPLVLVGSFVTWIGLLVLAFGMMLHALRGDFEPGLDGFGHALYVAGGSMATIGFSPAQPHGLARGIVVVAGLCGLAVMTLVIAYVLEVQGNIALRDTGVLKMTTVAGEPPSALTLLERYSALGCEADLAQVLRDGRDWCAAMQQSHASHPWLVYFRSVGTGAGWPSMLGALIDVAITAEMLLDDPALRGPATFAREQGCRLIESLLQLLDLDTKADVTSQQGARMFYERIGAAGYRLRADFDLEDFIRLRDEHAARVQVLARHLGTPEAPLVPR